MKNIVELFGPWHFCQTGLERTFRWSKYIQYNNGKPAKYNGIRRQNVAQHTLSKFLALAMISPTLQRVFNGGGAKINFGLLNSCVGLHDLSEGLRGSKYDILANDKKASDDAEEYELLMKFLDKVKLMDSKIRKDIQKSFLLQFALTSYNSFPAEAQVVMVKIRTNKTDRNTAVLFQILEKWEYFFYAYEHKDKHPTIWNDVNSRNGELIERWITEYPEKYHNPLREIFVS